MDPTTDTNMGDIHLKMEADGWGQPSVKAEPMEGDGPGMAPEPKKRTISETSDPETGNPETGKPEIGHVVHKVTENTNLSAKKKKAGEVQVITPHSVPKPKIFFMKLDEVVADELSKYYRKPMVYEMQPMEFSLHSVPTFMSTKNLPTMFTADDHDKWSLYMKLAGHCGTDPKKSFLDIFVQVFQKNPQVLKVISLQVKDRMLTAIQEENAALMANLSLEELKRYLQFQVPLVFFPQEQMAPIVAYREQGFAYMVLTVTNMMKIHYPQNNNDTAYMSHVTLQYLTWMKEMNAWVFVISPKRLAR